MQFRNASHLLLRGAKASVLVALIVAALYVSVGRSLVGASDSYREDLQEILAARYAIDVHLGQISGSWSYLDPIWTIKDVRFGDADDPVLAIDTAQVQIGSLQSLRGRRVVVTEIDVRGLRLAAEETSPGRWQIVGLPPTDAPVNLDVVLDALPHLNSVSVVGLEISLAGLRAGYKVQDVPEEPIRLVARQGLRTFSMPIRVARSDVDDERRALLMGDYRGDFRTPDFASRLYLSVSDLAPLDFLPAPGPLSQLDSVLINGEVWADIEGDRLELRGIASAEGRLARADRQPASISANVTFGALSTPQQVLMVGDDVSIGIEDQEASWRGLSAVLAHNRVAEDTNGATTDRQLGLILPSIDLQELSALVLELGSESGLVARKFLDAVSGTKPAGSLVSTVGILGLGENMRDTRLLGTLSSVSLEPYLGSPGITSLNGLLSLGTERGYIDIHNQQFEIHFKRSFAEPWPFDSARGRVNYRSNAGALQVSSGLIELEKDGLSASAKVCLRLGDLVEQHTWGLAIGIHGADLRDAYRYLPSTLSPELSDWLSQAIRSGGAVESGLVFHGAPNRTMPRNRKAYDTYFEVEEGVLEYHPDWPILRGVDTTVRVSDAGAFTEGASGSVYESDVRSIEVSVPAPVDRLADAIHVSASMQGPIADGIRILNETPIALQLSNAAADWSGKGQIAGTVVLEVPIGPRNGEDVQGDVEVTMDGNDLAFPEFDLHASELRGELRYRTDAGLTSAGFTGALFGEPITGTIGSDMARESGETTVHVQGRVSAEDLYRWSEQNLLTKADGTASYEASVHMPFGATTARTYVEATSDLVGVRLDLPQPLTKDAGLKRPLYYRQEFLEPGLRIDMSLGELQSALVTLDDVVQGGQLHFGPGTLNDPSFELFTVTGSVGNADYEEWDRFFIEMESRSDVSLESELAARFDTMDLSVGNLSLFSLELESVQAQVKRGADSWRAFLANDVLRGEFTVPDDDESPLIIALEYLRFPDEGAGGDPMQDVVPQDLGDLDVTISELMYGDEPYGNWAFKLRPDGAGAMLRELTAESKGLSIQEGAELTWRIGDDGRHESAFTGMVAASDLGRALREWGYASSIEGSDFLFDAGLSWDGTPAAIDLDIVRGRMSLENGEGRFVQAETGTGALKLLGIFDFAQIARRFRFDFSDVVQKGWSFSEITGVVGLDRGLVNVVDEIVIEGSTSIFTVGGNLDLISRELDGDMIVTLPLSRNLPWYAAYSAIATGPLAGVGVLLAQKIFGSQLDQMSSAKYEISGTIEEPKIEFVAIFDDSVREAGAEAPAEP